jgi:hypothetical protein
MSNIVIPPPFLECYFFASASTALLLFAVPLSIPTKVIMAGISCTTTTRAHIARKPITRMPLLKTLVGAAAKALPAVAIQISPVVAIKFAVFMMFLLSLVGLLTAKRLKGAFYGLF